MYHHHLPLRLPMNSEVVYAADNINSFSHDRLLTLFGLGYKKKVCNSLIHTNNTMIFSWAVHHELNLKIMINIQQMLVKVGHGSV